GVGAEAEREEPAIPEVLGELGELHTAIAGDEGAPELPDAAVGHVEVREHPHGDLARRGDAEMLGEDRRGHAADALEDRGEPGIVDDLPLEGIDERVPLVVPDADEEVPGEADALGLDAEPTGERDV